LVYFIKRAHHNCSCWCRLGRFIFFKPWDSIGGIFRHMNQEYSVPTFWGAKTWILTVFFPFHCSWWFTCESKFYSLQHSFVKIIGLLEYPEIQDHVSTHCIGYIILFCKCLIFIVLIVVSILFLETYLSPFRSHFT
jgi:hypothetical protein